MKKFLFICLKSVLFLIRLAFYPLKIFCTILYGVSNPNIVGYAWYSKEEYPNLIESSDDGLDEIVPTYDLWREKADKNVEKYKRMGWIVIKVSIEMKELEAWLQRNDLINISENRQKYVNHRMRHFLDNSII